jgi:hypothetical protein
VERMNTEEWIKVLAPQDKWNERHFLSAVSVLGIPETYLDVGSGTGAMVNIARKLGVNAWGVDQIERPDTWLIKYNLNSVFRAIEVGAPGKFQLVTCLEVAEHMPPESDSTICQTIAQNSGRGTVLLFSSAHPGQGGDDHVGVRPAYHWRTILTGNGFSYNQELTTRIVLAWLNIGSPLMWLVDNIQVFVK